MAGTIILQANGKYKLTFMKHRQRYYKTVSANNEKEAKELLKKFIKFVDKVVDIDINVCTFEDFCTLYFKDYAPGLLAEECIYNYTKALQNWVLPKIGLTPLADCSKQFFINYFNWLEKQISPTTHQCLSIGSREKIYGIMSSIFSCAIQWKILKNNTLREARPEEFKNKNKKKINAAKNKQRCLTIEESRKLMQELKNVDLKYQLITHFAIMGGLRRSEILGLKWADVNFKEQHIVINQSSLYVPKKGYIIGELKTDTSCRTIAIPKVTMLLLLDYKIQTEGIGKSDNDFIFINDKGRRKGLRMNPTSVTAWFKRFRKKIGLPDEVPLHGLRHTNATILITKGINVKNVSSRLGHANTSTTLNIYAHTTSGIDKASGQTLDKILFNRNKVFKIARKKKVKIMHNS